MIQIMAEIGICQEWRIRITCDCHTNGGNTLYLLGQQSKLELTIRTRWNQEVNEALSVLKVYNE